MGGRHSTSEAPLSPSLTPWEPQWEGRGEGSLLGQSQAVHPNPHCTPQKTSLLLWLNLLWARDASDESTDQPRLAPHLETPEAQPWDPWRSREAGSDLHLPQRQGLLQLLTAPSSLGFIARPEHGMFIVQVSPASLWEAGDTPKEMSSFER